MPPSWAFETLAWEMAGSPGAAPVEYASSLPPLLADRDLPLAPATLDHCVAAALEVTVAARSIEVICSDLLGLASVLSRAESLASCLIDGHTVSSTELARAEASLPSSRAARRTEQGVRALEFHLSAAKRALGLGALAAAHTAPGERGGRRRQAAYRRHVTWEGGSDLWPREAAYVPPRPDRIPALMDDVVEFCASARVDPIAQAAIAHGQILAIQPFDDANGRAARTTLNGVWVRRGLLSGVPVPISAALWGDHGRYDAAVSAFRAGEPDPLVGLVAQHSIRAAKQAVASAVRLTALPDEWRERARPRAGSAALALTALLVRHPVINAGDVMRLTGASQASAYGAIVRLADAGILERLSVGRRDTMWMARDVWREVDDVVARLGRPA